MINKIYSHNKTGKKYLVVAEAFDCTNRNESCPMVIYRDYTFYETTLLKYFVRDAEEFKIKFTEYKGEPK